MVFTDKCNLCGKETAFHDDEKDSDLMLCPECHAVWVRHKIINDIMSGDLVLPDNDPLDDD